MPRFRYQAKDANGKDISSETEAYDQSTLVESLQERGLFVFKVEEVQAPKVEKASRPEKASTVRKFTHKKIELNDLLTFSNQMTTLLESGVILLRSLEVIQAQIESENFYKVLAHVTKRVEEGIPLSAALAEHPRVFNQFWVSLVEVGEASGTMPIVLQKLAFYLKQQAEFRSTITSAIMYPAILFVVCMGAVSFFALFVGPRFETVFSSMNVELPLITRVLLGTFRIIKEKFLLIVGAVTIVVFFFKKWLKTTPGRNQSEKIFFSMPVIGKIFKLIIVERFASQMAILVESGVPILVALDIVERLVDNLTCARVISQIKERVKEGELLVGPMERSRFFPPLTIQMITVGEETGELSKMLKHVAEFYQKEVETTMKRIGTIIEPFMLVFMGAVIGVIVLAMFLPMFNISQLGGGGGGK